MKIFVPSLLSVLLFSLSHAASASLKETSVSLAVLNNAASSHVANLPDHVVQGTPSVAFASDSLGHVVLQDVTGDVMGFLQNIGDQTRATMEKLANGLQYAVGFAGGVLDGIFHGQLTNLSSKAWLGPLSDVVTAGSNLMVHALSNSSDPSSLISAEAIHALATDLEKFVSLSASFGIDTARLSQAVSSLSDFAGNLLNRRSSLFVDIDTLVVGHFKPTGV